MYKIFIGCLGGRFLVKDGIVFLEDGPCNIVPPSDNECKSLTVEDLLKIKVGLGNKKVIKEAFMELIYD